MLITIILVFAILATDTIALSPIASIKGWVKTQSGNWGTWAVIGAIIAALTVFITTSGIDLILMNPTVAGPNANPAIANTVNSFLYLLIPFYIIALIITGIYFLFSQSPSGRAKSKSMFFKLIISMGAVLIALPLFQLLLDISNGIAQLIFSIGGDYVNIEKIFGVTSSISIAISALFIIVPQGKLIAFIFFLFIALTLIAVALIFVVRYLLVVLAAIIFPFTLVLWLFDFPYIRHIGAKLMNHTIVWIFVPVVTAVVVVITSIIAGGFYDKCSLGGINIFDPDCWLSFFAGIAATFLILAAPLMMYGIMAWLGVTILLFGWTAMAAPRTAEAGWGPGSIFYYFPGADIVFRIPGFEKFAEKVLGATPLYGTEGGFVGWTTITEGFHGEFPIGAPPIYRGARAVFRKVTGRLPPTPSPEEMGRGVLYGRDYAYKIVGEKRYKVGHPRTFIPKLGPVGVVAAGGLLAGMGPLGMITAGLKGLWYEPGASFPMEMDVPLAVGGSRRIIATESYVKSYTPGDVLRRAPNAAIKCYPKEMEELLGIIEKNPSLLTEAGKSIENIKNDPKVEKAELTRLKKLLDDFELNLEPDALLTLKKAIDGWKLIEPKELDELKLHGLSAEKIEQAKVHKLRDLLNGGLSNNPAAIQELAEKTRIDREELTHAMVPPPMVPEEAAEKKRKEMEDMMLDEIPDRGITDKISGVLRKERDLKQKIPKTIPWGERLREMRRIEEGIDKEIKTDSDLKKFGKKWIAKDRKIEEELKEKRTYIKHPIRRGLEDKIYELARWRKGAPETLMEQVEFVMGEMWPPFGQTARILSRETYLMHGFKALKVYTPTPPKVPDWVKRRWEEEAKRG